MTKPTLNQVAMMAEKACFYTQPDGRVLRILYCDSDSLYFQAIDEDSCEEFSIDFEDVTLEKGEQFMGLVKLEVPVL